MSSPDTTARLARRLHLLVTLLCAGTALLLAWPLLLTIALGPAQGHWGTWSELVPPLVYLWGLFELRRALGGIARGETFGPAVRRALTRLGAAMLAGALLEVVVVPNLVFWLLGPGRGGALLQFDVGAFSVGAIGAGLVLIARLFDAAAAMAAELDGFF